MTKAPVETRRIALPSGTLEIEVHSQQSPAFPLDMLCDFAARNNPKRGFLVVSRVLGRHIPASPIIMDRLHHRLAAQIGDDLPGPVLFIGMAETAVCLGQAIHAAWRDSTGRPDSMFIHSTRQVIDAADIVAEFSEPHSHAARHILYAPLNAALRAMFLVARSLVLIDDEASTGTTFLNAARALAPLLPHLETVTTSVITDWSPSDDWRAGLGFPGASLSLLRGRLQWTANPGHVSAQPPVSHTGALGRIANRINYGRRGDSDGLHILPDGLDYGGLAQRIAGHHPGQNFLVIGTGEFTYPPYRLALEMAHQGHSVHMSSITRSPVHIGGAIGSALSFHDNYGAGVPNFLYNVAPEPGQTVIICCETGADSVDPALVRALGAEVLNFGTMGKT